MIWRKLEKLVVGIELGLVGVSFACLTLIFILIMSEIVARTFFDSPIPMVMEAVGYFTVAVIFGAVAYCQRQRQHVVVDVLIGRFPPRVQTGLEILAYITALLTFIILGWQTSLWTIVSYQVRELTWGLYPLPIWPMKAFIALGSFVISIELLINIVYGLRALLGRAPLVVPEERPTFEI